MREARPRGRGLGAPPLSRSAGQAHLGRAAPRELTPAVRAAVWSVDKDQPVVRIATMDQLLEDKAIDKATAILLGKKGKEMVQYLKELDEKWNKIGFGSLNVEIKNEQVGFSVPLYPGKLNPDEFRVELYAEQKDDKAVERHGNEGTRKRQAGGILLMDNYRSLRGWGWKGFSSA